MKTGFMIFSFYQKQSRIPVIPSLATLQLQQGDSVRPKLTGGSLPGQIPSLPHLVKPLTAIYDITTSRLSYLI